VQNRDSVNLWLAVFKGHCGCQRVGNAWCTRVSW